eukprot:1237904-Amphidinium_carterae.2
MEPAGHMSHPSSVPTQEKGTMTLPSMPCREQTGQTRGFHQEIASFLTSSHLLDTSSTSINSTPSPRSMRSSCCQSCNTNSDSQPEKTCDLLQSENRSRWDALQ